MDDIGVVPEDAEIRRGGLHGGEAADHSIRIGLALRVAVFGDAPDALDGRVRPGQLLDPVHIRAVLPHGDGDHLEAQLLGDGKMPVVARDGAEPPDLFQLAPGGKARRAKYIEPQHGIIHHGQAGVAPGDDLLHGDLHQLGKERPAGAQPVQPAVVAGVGGAVLQIFVAVQDGEHGLAQIQLLPAGLAPGHIQLEVFRPAGIIFCLKLLPVLQKRCAICCQNVHKPFSFSP